MSQSIAQQKSAGASIQPWRTDVENHRLSAPWWASNNKKKL